MTFTARRRACRARRLATAVAAVVSVFLLASVLGARIVVAGSRRGFAVPAGAIGHRHLEVTFRSRVDGVRLSGWLFRADHPSGRSVILVHGWQGDREDVDFVALTRSLLPLGYDVLMFDLRGSGLSDGSNQTLAHREPRDLLGAYDHMLSLGYRPGQMTVLGNSMGAATVIEAAPELTVVGALVADSAFADLFSTMQGGLTHYTLLPGLLAIPAIEVSRVFGVQPDLSPMDVVRSLPARAFLIIHAVGDPLLSVANADQLFAASSNPASRLAVIDGHDHLDTFTHDPSAYLTVLLAFIDQQVGRPGRQHPPGTAWSPIAQPGIAHGETPLLQRWSGLAPG
jgi:pimeloyl-ACP methyl ester carboxylesterase